jgi:hypothetical protein
MDILAQAVAIVQAYAAKLDTVKLAGWDFHVGSIGPEFDL